MKVYVAHPNTKKTNPLIKYTINYYNKEGNKCININREENNTKYSKKPSKELGKRIWDDNLKNINKCDLFVAIIPNEESVFETIAETLYAFILDKKCVIITDVKHSLIDWMESRGAKKYKRSEFMK